MQINSLAAFRRFLKTPGARIQLIRHDGHAANPEKWKKADWSERTVAKVQHNSVKFSNGSWLMWHREGAAMFRFDNTDIVTVNFARPDAEPFSQIFQYRCW